MSFEGKVVAITGGASGMGLATAKLLADKNVRLSLADLQAEKLEQAAKDFRAAGKSCMTTVLDVTKSADVDAWIAATVKEFGQLDYAVNCAGTGNPALSLIKDTTDEGWHLVQNVNLNGVFYSIRAQLRAMENKGGSIVSISSSAGLSGFPYQASYSASKHGVIGLTKTAAKEAGPKIRVNCVCPGIIDTPMLQGAPGHLKTVFDTASEKSPAGRAGSAEEVAKLMVFLLSDDASFITGTAYIVDGGLLAGLT